jgi:hypothetical protein
LFFSNLGLDPVEGLDSEGLELSLLNLAVTVGVVLGEDGLESLLVPWSSKTEVFVTLSGNFLDFSLSENTLGGVGTMQVVVQLIEGIASEVENLFVSDLREVHLIFFLMIIN